jgi:acyl carrier protein
MHIEYRWERQKRTLGRSRRRWVNNTKMDFRETGWDSIDLIDLAQDKDH